MRSGFGCVGVKMCATLWCASTIRCCSSGGRAEVHPGLYSSRSLCVNIRSGCNVTPQHPASSYFREAKKSCVPGGVFICLLWTLYVACIWSFSVVAGGLVGGSPYVPVGMIE